jgi:xanthine dehydrogenase YagR molybdenum-binding subunit
VVGLAPVANNHWGERPETDDWVNPLGVKGLGELGNVGVNAAVANAVYHATGVRVRDLHIRLEKLLSA